VFAVEEGVAFGELVEAVFEGVDSLEVAAWGQRYALREVRLSCSSSRIMRRRMVYSAS
jgi:hypothetical protein